MGTGLVHHRSSKQKLNVKSSTEAEIVGTSEYVPYNVWLWHFLEAQGYNISDNILFKTTRVQSRWRRTNVDPVPAILVT